jgi:NADH:ubiquinone oxidoreductase subunit B-like Fe-S oxidoreductase
MRADEVMQTIEIIQSLLKQPVETYDAVPTPKVVIAVGSCTLSGGPFRGSLFYLAQNLHRKILVTHIQPPRLSFFLRIDSYFSCT